MEARTFPSQCGHRAGYGLPLKYKVKHLLISVLNLQVFFPCIRKQKLMPQGMEKLISYTVNNLEIKKLDRQKALEAVFYIDYLLNQEVNFSDANRLLNLKTQVLKHINTLDKIEMDSFNKS